MAEDRVAELWPTLPAPKSENATTILMAVIDEYCASGCTRRCDGWERIFESREGFEAWVARAEERRKAAKALIM